MFSMHGQHVAGNWVWSGLFLVDVAIVFLAHRSEFSLANKALHLASCSCVCRYVNAAEKHYCTISIAPELSTSKASEVMTVSRKCKFRLHYQITCLPMQHAALPRSAWSCPCVVVALSTCAAITESPLSQFAPFFYKKKVCGFNLLGRSVLFLVTSPGLRMEAFSTATWCGATLVALFWSIRLPGKRAGPERSPLRSCCCRTPEAKVKCAHVVCPGWFSRITSYYPGRFF